MYLKRIDRSEINKYLNESKKKAPGASKINKQIIEKCTDKFLDQLTNINNACLYTRYFPQAFKKLSNLYLRKTNHQRIHQILVRYLC